MEGKKKQQKIKIDLKSINYFYMQFQTHFTYKLKFERKITFFLLSY